MAERARLSLFVVSTKSGLVLLINHLALIFLLRIAIVFPLGFGSTTRFFLVLLIRSSLFAIAIRFSRGVCRLSILSWSVLHWHVLGEALSLLHLRHLGHGCARYRRLVSSKGHSEELLLALSGRVSEVVNGCHYGDNGNEAGRCIKHEGLLRL